MSNVAENRENAKPEELFRKTADPAERKRIASAVVTAYRSRVAAVVRSVLSTRQHWAEAEQAGIVGLLEALDQYDPEIAGEDRGAAFWGFARFRVFDAIRDWISDGIYWRKVPDRHRGERRAANREAAKVHSVHLSADETILNEIAEDETPETLAIQSELHWKANEVLGELSPRERAAVVSSDGRIVGSRHHKIAVARARAAFTKKAVRDGCREAVRRDSDPARADSTPALRGAAREPRSRTRAR